MKDYPISLRVLLLLADFVHWYARKARYELEFSIRGRRDNWEHPDYPTVYFDLIAARKKPKPNETH